METALYFAYGSNMSHRRIERRVGPVEKIGKIKLKGWKLVFNCGHLDCAYANIVKEPTSYVEGILYKLTEEQIARLDNYEGYPRNYQKFYAKFKSNIIYAYISTTSFFKTIALPDIEYLDIILLGAHENDMETLIQELLKLRYEIIQRTRKEKRTKKTGRTTITRQFKGRGYIR